MTEVCEAEQNWSGKSRQTGSCGFDHAITAQFKLRLHERSFISIRFHDFVTASKWMRFGSVYTEPFLYSLRHAEVITDQRDLGTKKESTILFFSAWRKVHLCSLGLTTRSNSFEKELTNTKSVKWLGVLIGSRSRGNIVIFWIASEKKRKCDVM